ncbi:serine/threonine-protein kinase [Paludibaculum fermentans]|uniref:Serine/threonine protein kinase n=1 Tax=Paludibaculum fermentans TaxID=1473598 RepID=A0A7S7NWR8_PALFE|nr:serine/threonine-protein kinase [Paludibaculum fermentans]QOY91166.1 serine/threonine protein kinase [Paludibaculum fermentans]
MAPHQPDRTAEIFDRLLDLPVEQRGAALAAECHGDSELCARVEALLRADEAAAARTLWQGSALDAQAKLVARHDPDAQAGLRLGAYRVVKTLGQGGMGTVYLAVRDDDAYEKRVAIKLIQHGLDSEEALRRFRSERQILAQMEHPNIARLIDGGNTADGLPYLVMEHVNGIPLDEYARRNQLPLSRKLELFGQVCSAVQYAHRSLVVHRDLKPANILVDGDGVPKLLDFGIATLVGPQEFTVAHAAMTPGYASPEQLRGRNVTTSADVFALGVLLFELLTGAKPFHCEAHTPEQLAQAVERHWPVHAAGLGRDWQAIFRRALAPDVELRYESAAELLRDVNAWRGGQPVAARSGGRVYRTLRLISRNRLAAAAVAVALTALVAGIITTSIQARRAERRFNEVRSLANSLLFEFYDSVKDVPGSTAARELLVKRAREYLDSLAADRAGDETLQRELAEAYWKLGNIQGQPYGQNVGDSSGAIESYRKSQQILEGCLRDAPGDRAASLDLVHTLQAQGPGLIRLGRTADAETSIRRASVVAQGLLNQDPANSKLTEEVAQCLRQLGNAVAVRASIQNDRQLHLEALKIYRQALVLQQKLTAAAPESLGLRMRLGSSMTYVGYALQALAASSGDRSLAVEALDLQRRSLEIFRQVAESAPKEAGLQRNLGDAWNNYGAAQSLNLQWEPAIDSHRAALRIHSGLAAADPRNIEAKRDLVETHRLLSKALWAGGHRAEGRAMGEQALREYQVLQALDPSDAENQRLLNAAMNELQPMRQ